MHNLIWYTHCHSWCTIWYGTHRYCWPTSSFPRIQLHTGTHLYGSVYAMAGSHFNCCHHSRNGSLRICRQLDRMIWRSFDNLNQQGTPVWFKLGERTDAFTRFKTYRHHTIPSKLQQRGGTVALTTQDFTARLMLTHLVGFKIYRWFFLAYEQC